MTAIGEREARLVARTSTPRTVQTLETDLRALGVRAGDACIVHCSLSRIGWINGGAVAFVRALQNVVTAEGTLVMPTHSSDLSSPESWEDPAIPAQWRAEVRATMPAYDPAITPTRYMSRVAELFRTMPGVLRSAHPRHSFAAWGRCAETITRGHTLSNSMGDGSPLGRLYDLDAKVALVGVTFESNTSFHLAEYRANVRKTVREEARVMSDGEEVWREYDDVALDPERFDDIGHDFVRTGACTEGLVGSAASFVFRQRAAVDFATRWLTAPSSSSGSP